MLILSDCDEEKAAITAAGAYFLKRPCTIKVLLRAVEDMLFLEAIETCHRRPQFSRRRLGLRRGAAPRRAAPARMNVMRQYLSRHPDSSLDAALVDILVEAIDDAWRDPKVENIRFEDRLSLKQTLCRRMIGRAKLGHSDAAELCADGVAFLQKTYMCRWRN